jgi:hypothetical protein
MHNRKQQKEIDKAISNLMKYSEQDNNWGNKHEQFFNSMLLNVASYLDITPDEVVIQFEDIGYMIMIFEYIFELFITSQCDDEEFTMIEDYIKRRGWREPPYAKRYLSGLNESKIKLWEIVSVKPGDFVDVRPFGTTDKPLCVYEQSGSQNLKRWDCLAARVVTLDSKKGFSGTILPFSPEEAEEVSLMLEQVYSKTTKTLEQTCLEDDSCNWSEAQIIEVSIEEIEEKLPYYLFDIWVTNTYRAITAPLPTVVNNNGDIFQWSKVTFPVIEYNITAIKIKLDSTPVLEFNDDAMEWLWLAGDAKKEPEQGISILGHITLNEKSLELSVNSSKRSEEGIVYLTALLGDLIGQPLTVHENMESRMEQYSQSGSQELTKPVEDPELITAYLDQHYKKTLDKSLHVLNNKTPRECSRHVEQQQRLIQWLKGLENKTIKNKNLAHYDFRWMWEELGIEYPD